MNQIAIGKLKTMPVSAIRASMPVEITADGAVIGILQEKFTPRKAKTKCPNCKLVYDYTEPDGKPGFFSGKHPKG